MQERLICDNRGSEQVASAHLDGGYMKRSTSPLMWIIPAASLLAMVLFDAGTLGGEAGEADEPVTVVRYAFEDEQHRAAPSEVHPDIEAGPIMQPGFFPPTNRWFDGSVAGEPGEAVVAAGRPAFYEITVENLDRVGPLVRLSFDVTTRRRHAAAGHVISITTLADDQEEGTPLKLDLLKPDDDPGDPTVKGVEKVGVGEAGGRRVEGEEQAYLGWSGNTGTISVDLSDLEHVQLRRFRIHFEHRGQTAIDNIELTAAGQP